MKHLLKMFDWIVTYVQNLFYNLFIYVDDFDYDSMQKQLSLIIP